MEHGQGPIRIFVDLNLKGYLILSLPTETAGANLNEPADACAVFPLSHPGSMLKDIET
jgi:hypothetical protein